MKDYFEKVCQDCRLGKMRVLVMSIRRVRLIQRLSSWWAMVQGTSPITFDWEVDQSSWSTIFCWFVWNVDITMIHRLIKLNFDSKLKTFESDDLNKIYFQLFVNLLNQSWPNKPTNFFFDYHLLSAPLFCYIQFDKQLSMATSHTVQQRWFRTNVFQSSFTQVTAPDQSENKMIEKI